MKTIETTAVVGNDRQMTVQLPDDVSPGTHRVVVVIDEPTIRAVRSLNNFPTIDVGPWPNDLSLRREDMYGDHGR